jgi:hypothetical protein
MSSQLMQWPVWTSSTQPGRVGSHPSMLRRLVVRNRIVRARKPREEAKVLRRLICGDALVLDAELASDRLGDHLKRMS